MLDLDINPSYIDLSLLVISSGLSWEDVGQLLRPHPLNPVKPSLESYSSILRPDILDPVLKPLNDFLPVYLFGVEEEIFLVHHGAIGYTLDLLGLSRHDRRAVILYERALELGKQPVDGARMRLLRQAHITLWNLTQSEIEIDKQLIQESYDEYNVLRHSGCCENDCSEHGINLEDYTLQTISRIVEVVSDVISMELKLCGGGTLTDQLPRDEY